MSARFMAASALAALALAAAGAVRAQMTVTADFTMVDTDQKTDVTSPSGYVGLSYASPLLMTVTSGPGPQSLYVFCIDIYDEIGTRETGLTYTPTSLADFNGGSGTTLLTADQVLNIGKLIGHGETLIETQAGAASLDAQLAGVQDAIWSTEYPGAGFSFEPTDKAAKRFEAADLAMLADLPAAPLVEAYVNGDTQGLGGGPTPTPPSGAGTPEPASWALMTLGAGFAGAALRRRRATPRTTVI